MFSLFYLPLLASAALGASHIQHRDFHHHLAREHARALAASQAGSSTTTSTNASNATVDMVAASYFAAWHASNPAYNFTLDDVSWEKYTHLIYAFGYVGLGIRSIAVKLTFTLACRTTDPRNPNGVNLTSDDDALLTQFVAKAQNNSVKAMLSVGGWTGGLAYSSNVGSAENRTAYVKTIIDLKTKFNLDGVDFE
jgi:chitinase